MVNPTPYRESVFAANVILRSLNKPMSTGSGSIFQDAEHSRDGKTTQHWT